MVVLHVIVQRIRIVIFACITSIFYLSCLHSAMLHIYVNSFYPIEQKLSFFIKSISFISEKGNTLKFRVNKKIASEASFSQQFLKTVKIPEGKYTILKIKIKKATFNNKEMKIKSPYFDLNLNLKISDKQTKALFVLWNIRSSVKEGEFVPVFAVQRQNSPLRGEMLFITSDSANTFYVVRVDTNQVSATINISGAPKEMALSCLNDRVFVVSKNNGKVNIIEVSTFRLLDSFVLPVVNSPEFIEKGKTGLYIADPEYDTIINVDEQTGSLLNNIKIGDGLSDILYVGETDKIVISAYNDRNIYILDSSLNTQKILKTEGSPKSVFYDSGKLFVSNFDTGILSVRDFSTMETEKNIRIMSPLKAVKSDNRLFVADYNGKKIDIVNLEQNEAVRSIYLPGKPFKLSVCFKRGWLYAALRNRKEIAVIDILKESVMGFIQLGSKPYDVKVGRSGYIGDKCY